MDKSKNYLIKDFDIRGTEYSYYDQIPNMRRLNSRKRLEMYNGDETKDVYDRAISLIGEWLKKNGYSR